MATSVMAQYLNSKLPASAYTYTVRSGLPQQANSSDCVFFVCRYLNELVSGSYFAFDIATSHNRRWLAQFVLDEAINQTPSVEIMQPSALNRISGVTYLYKACSVSIPDVFFDKHQSVCTSNPDAIIGSTTRRQEGPPKKMVGPVIDLTGSTIDLSCTYFPNAHW